ncbi:hypothetical protein BOTBODRAFT_26575 [Botryobasidium botryosum FD-172 SS1]|uniref:Uncharacterized protein n=1 Tax=Botryobasidium botryosum (strain FD-172 SS1) TaxID=930990 RepID=A0A067N9V2_BOTB1|nr:hypothetical protein BOTBODRAFT_26575 [Botryobasidium botryosum FD-172 SS1]
MRLTFTPPLGSTHFVLKNPDLDAVITFYVTLPVSEYLSSVKEGARVQIWSDIPQAGRASGWAECDFEPDVAAANPPPGIHGLAITKRARLDLGESTRGAFGFGLVTLVARFNIPNLAHMPQQSYSYTYRILRASSCDWLGSPGSNGRLVLGDLDTRPMNALSFHAPSVGQDAWSILHQDTDSVVLTPAIPSTPAKITAVPVSAAASSTVRLPVELLRRFLPGGYETDISTSVALWSGDAIPPTLVSIFPKADEADDFEVRVGQHGGRFNVTPAYTIGEGSETVWDVSMLTPKPKNVFLTSLPGTARVADSPLFQHPPLLFSAVTHHPTPSRTIPYFDMSFISTRLESRLPPIVYILALALLNIATRILLFLAPSTIFFPRRFGLSPFSRSWHQGSPEVRPEYGSPDKNDDWWRALPKTDGKAPAWTSQALTFTLTPGSSQDGHICFLLHREKVESLDASLGELTVRLDGKSIPLTREEPGVLVREAGDDMWLVELHGRIWGERVGEGRLDVLLKTGS